MTLPTVLRGAYLGVLLHYLCLLDRYTIYCVLNAYYNVPRHIWCIKFEETAAIRTNILWQQFNMRENYNRLSISMHFIHL